MGNEYGYFHAVGKIYDFLIHLAVVLGGLISLSWLAGCLFLYGQLGQPVWEWAILVAVILFGFCWFCVRESNRRKLRASAGKPADEDNWGEGRDELEVHLAEIEEELSEARQRGAKGMIEKLEEGREDVLSQLEGLDLEGKVEELHRLRDEAGAAGRGGEVREYSKKADKHNARLKERGDRLEDLPPVPRTFAYGILTTFILCFAFMFLLIPLFMLLITVTFWDAWTGAGGFRGSAQLGEWLRAPGVMAPLIAASLVLACVGVRVASWHFSPETPETGKENLWENRAK